MNVNVRKAILLFLVLFLTWHVLYYITFLFPFLSKYWLFAYLVVFMVEVCFFVLDKQKISDLGITKHKAWKKYFIVGFIFAVAYSSYLIVIGASLFSLGPSSTLQHGMFTIPYNILLALIVGLVEETAFRGYILRNFCKAFSNIEAIAYSSILFGLYHLSLVYIFVSPFSILTFTYWTLFVLFATITGIFLGYFYTSTGKTTIGTITYHSFTIFIGSSIPFGIVTSQENGYILSITFYIIAIPIMVFLKRKELLSNTE
ncbi:MAG: CPBP family intramembrane glutamic endopeptidase [Candidatus Bathyarchaeia archaeon]